MSYTDQAEAPAVFTFDEPAELRGPDESAPLSRPRFGYCAHRFTSAWSGEQQVGWRCLDCRAFRQ
jgi:hypothetical protein